MPISTTATVGSSPSSWISSCSSRTSSVSPPPPSPSPSPSPLIATPLPTGLQPLSSPLHPPPRPWRWRCRSCARWYRLGCTSRCLSCNDTFYSTLREPEASGKSRSRNRSSRRRSNNQISPRSTTQDTTLPLQSRFHEFDCNAWEAHMDCWASRRDFLRNAGEWRRWAHEQLCEESEIVWEEDESEYYCTPKDAAARIRQWQWEVDRVLAVARGRARVRRFRNRTHSCFEDCYYPSQCYQERLQMRKEEEEEEDAEEERQARNRNRYDDTEHDAEWWI